MLNVKNTIITHITLFADSLPKGKPVYVYAKQNDMNSRIIVVDVLSASGGRVSCGAAQLNISKPDGTHSYIAGEINEDDSISFKLKAQSLSAYGRATCDVTLFESNEDYQSILTTHDFYMIIDETNYDESAIEDSDEFSSVSDSLVKIESNRLASESAMNQAIAAAEEAKTTLQIIDDKTVGLPAQIAEVQGQLDAYKDDVNRNYATKDELDAKALEIYDALGSTSSVAVEAESLAGKANALAQEAMSCGLAANELANEALNSALIADMHVGQHRDEVNAQIGDIETALDSIIAIQKALIGGAS